MSFDIGQKVICIHKWRTPYPGVITPQFMQIYTVRGYSPCDNIPSILLHEIHNSDVIFVRTFRRGEPSFAEKFFRPLQKLETEQELEIVA